MDTLAPQSLLDNRSRERESTAVYRDRITRRTSPARVVSPRYEDQEYDEDIEVRVSQPYRTSFSAIAKPKRTRRDRSRSTSPGLSSMKSDRSRSKSPGYKKHSPKHVTYDSKVTIRHSDSFEQQVTELSGGDLSHNSSLDSSFDKTDSSPVSGNQSNDYSSRIREMSQMIVKEYSSNNRGSPENDLEPVKTSPQTQTKSPNDNSTAPKSVPVSSNGRVPGRRIQQHSTPRNNVSKEYNHDRTVSYRKAITDQYSDEIKRLANTSVEETYTDPSYDPDFPRGQRTERSNSVPSHPRTESDSNRLTPAKKTISGSINNFFRRLSPRVLRKSRRDKGSTSSVSSQQDSVSGDHDNSGHFSRNKIRQSFMKLMGRSKSRSNSKSREDVFVPDDKPAKVTPSNEGQHHQQLPPSSNRILKSIEQNSLNDRDVYHRFKDRQSPNRQGEIIPAKPQAVKVSGEVTPQSLTKQPESGDFCDGGLSPVDNKENESFMDRPVSGVSGTTQETIHPSTSLQQRSVSKPEPPHTLDVRQVPKSVKILQSSMYSSLSADESIGDCSLDVNMTGSEPSLLSGGSESEASKKVVSSQKDISCTKIPSYLRISCAVSGYGQYSGYKSIEKRSPFSSSSSLRSEPMSPDMPVTKVISPSHQRTSTSNSLGLCKLNNVVNGDITNGDCSLVINGHSKSSEDRYPTGDKKVDGEYFLGLTRLEENRILSQCRQIDPDINCPDLPEEAHGKIRATIGKANLLINQKFKQFQDLCSEHMNPSEDGKPLLWKDLQGFWDMIKIQIDNVDEMFTEIELMRQNGWKELSIHSRGSSVSSSPKSGSLSLSNTSTPAGTPGSSRKTKVKDTPESSPERTEKMRQAAKARDEARKRLLAERRAAMKQKQQKQAEQDIQIFISEPSQ